MDEKLIYGTGISNQESESKYLILASFGKGKGRGMLREYLSPDSLYSRIVDFLEAGYEVGICEVSSLQDPEISETAPRNSQ